MKKMMMALSAALLAVSAMVVDTKPAEARRGGAIVAGVIGGLALGAILAHKHRRHNRAYYYDEPYYYSGSYYRPYYGTYYYAPRRHYRVYRYHDRRYRW